MKLSYIKLKPSVLNVVDQFCAVTIYISIYVVMDNDKKVHRVCKIYILICMYMYFMVRKLLKL